MSHPRQIRDWIRLFNRNVFNRVTLRLAGAAHSPFVIVRHVGRRSGKRYATPIIAQPIAGGFMIALTYGREVDWYRNVLAAGRCGLRWHNEEYAIEKLVPVDAKTGLPAFPWFEKQILKMLGIRYFLRMECAR
jgi:deazaflavin-dependent oxidoreductase (nitroreductase family)